MDTANNRIETIAFPSSKEIIPIIISNNGTSSIDITFLKPIMMLVPLMQIL